VVAGGGQLGIGLGQRLPLLGDEPVVALALREVAR
jgi:hypothetical protein